MVSGERDDTVGMFLGSTTVLTLIMMNLIIAIMTDSFEKVITKKFESDNRQLNIMIMQFEKLLVWKR